MNKQHKLFSYGTLQLEKVQLETYGRLLNGKKDKLLNYQLEQIEITDPEVLAKSEQKHHPIATKTNRKSDFIQGMIFEINDQELSQTDQYEVDDYIRVLETFESGEKAWIYIKK